MLRTAHLFFLTINVLILVGCSVPDGFHYASSPILLNGDKEVVAAVRDRGTSRIYRLSLHGEPAVALTGGEDESPALSPDGNRLVFSRRNHVGGANLWVLDMTTGTETQLSHFPKSKDVFPVFVSAKRVVFLRALRHRSTSTLGTTWDDWDLIAADIDTAREDALTDQRYRSLSAPSFCGTLNVIVTEAYALGTTTETAPQFISINVADKTTTVLVDHSRVGSERLSSPQISADCQRTMFVKAQMDSDENGWIPYDIYLADGSFSNPSRLTQQGTYITTARFAGLNRVVFGSDPRRNNVVEMFSLELPVGRITRLSVQMP